MFMFYKWLGQILNSGLLDAKPGALTVLPAWPCDAEAPHALPGAWVYGWQALQAAASQKASIRGTGGPMAVSL